MRNIIKNYNETVKSIKKNPTEDNKQKFLIIFRELDIQLNKELNTIISKKSKLGKTLEKEIDRLEDIINATTYRENFRNSMLDDYKAIIGYKPKNLIGIPFKTEDYQKYLNNLKDGNEIVDSLIKDGITVNNLKKTLNKKKNKNKKKVQSEIDKIQRERAKKIDKLKNNQDVVHALYSFIIAAPYSEENSYIEYLLIKINSFKKGSEEKETKKKDKVALDSILNITDLKDVPNIGSVRPVNILNHLEEAKKKHKDLNIPSSGLLEKEKKIKVDLD